MYLFISFHGGKTNEKLRTYASQLQFGWGDKRQILVTPEEYAEAARAALDDGYDAIKVDPLEIDRNGDDCVFQNRNRNYSGLLLADQLKMGKRELPLCVKQWGMMLILS